MMGLSLLTLQGLMQGGTLDGWAAQKMGTLHTDALGVEVGKRVTEGDWGWVNTDKQPKF